MGNTFSGLPPSQDRHSAQPFSGHDNFFTGDFFSTLRPPRHYFMTFSRVPGSRSLTPSLGRGNSTKSSKSARPVYHAPLYWRTPIHPRRSHQVRHWWREALPLFLLGIRKAFETDLQAAVADVVYGEPLRIPGELLTPSADPVEHASDLLLQHATPPRPVHVRVPPSEHNSPGFRSRLQRPLPKPLTEREDTATALVRQAPDRINR
jgi:hypothetical protein